MQLTLLESHRSFFQATECALVSVLAHLGKPDTRLAVLDRGFRVPAQIIEYAAGLLPQIAPGLSAPTSEAMRRLMAASSACPSYPDSTTTVA